MPNDDLDDKKKIVLNQIIDSYLIDGAPVGSKTLSNKSEEMASSSSLRNIMSQLEDMGLIYSPPRVIRKTSYRKRSKIVC